MSKYNHNVRLLSYNLFGIDDEKRRYFAYELIYHLVKKVSSEDLRFINIPKNKLHDGEGGKFIVNFHRQTCLWKEV